MPKRKQTKKPNDAPKPKRVKGPQIESITIEDAHNENRTKKFINKQRTLVLGSRNITATHRHLIKDIRSLLPHSKEASKFDTKNEMSALIDLCAAQNCPNCIFFDASRRNDLHMYVMKLPDGPTIKFKITNVSTLAELKLTGNALKGSRPILHFDGNFDSSPRYQLIKELFTQVFATPKNHPKSKPFCDHMLSFFIVNDKIWFRNYQIVYKDARKQEKALVEIGPRFIMDPIRILEGPFQGKILFNSDNYKFTRVLKTEEALRYLANKKRKMEKKKKLADIMTKKRIDPVEAVFFEETTDEETQNQANQEEEFEEGMEGDVSMNDEEMEEMEEGEEEGPMEEGEGEMDEEEGEVDEEEGEMENEEEGEMENEEGEMEDEEESFEEIETPEKPTKKSKK